MAQLQSQQLAAQVAAIRAQAKLQPSAASGGAPPRSKQANGRSAWFLKMLEGCQRAQERWAVRGSAHASLAVRWGSLLLSAEAVQRAVDGASLRCCGLPCMRGMLKRDGCSAVA